MRKVGDSAALTLLTSRLVIYLSVCDFCLIKTNPMATYSTDGFYSAKIFFFLSVMILQENLS